MSQEAHETFWYFVNERYKIWLNRTNGLPKPWSEDPIFQEWKFCNVFRKYDKQTQNLLSYLNRHENDDPGTILFNIYLFRAFNLGSTYDLFGWTTDWHKPIALAMLDNHIEKGNKLTSGAYMIRGREGIPKQGSIVTTLDEIWEDRNTVGNRIIRGGHSLEKAHKILSEQAFWGWGPFTTYQVVLDLSYTPILCDPSDINNWCEFGPGAMRGLSLIFENLKEIGTLNSAKLLLREQYKYLANYVPQLNLQDVEFCLCELQKYWRLKHGGRSKEHYSGRT